MIDVYVRELDNVCLGLAYVGEGIVASALSFSRKETLRSLLRSLPPNSDYQILERGSDFADRTILVLKDVHLGRHEFKDFMLADEYISEPVARILKAAASIPIGYVTSYGNIAKVAGADPREVGQIMASNPLYPIVPCHRVVGADFSLVGYGGRKSPQALKAKLARLSKECRAFGCEKEISVDGARLMVYPTEYVVEKAKKHLLDSSRNRQRTLDSY